MHMDRRAIERVASEVVHDDVELTAEFLHGFKGILHQTVDDRVGSGDRFGIDRNHLKSSQFDRIDELLNTITTECRRVCNRCLHIFYARYSRCAVIHIFHDFSDDIHGVKRRRRIPKINNHLIVVLS